MTTRHVRNFYEDLGRAERTLGWMIGDWWAFAESRYGDRKAIVTAPGWEGPAYQTCMDSASVCRAFGTSRRREVLTFNHHREVAARDDADELLDWAEETIATTGRPRSTRELRAEVSRRRVTVGGHPSRAGARSKEGFRTSETLGPPLARRGEGIRASEAQTPCR